MTHRIGKTNHEPVAKIYILRESKLTFLLIFAIFLSLVIYISSIHIAISEGFEREKIQKDLKLLRQDIQNREELFMLKFSQFYDEYNSFFGLAETAGTHFVTRNQNVAQLQRPLVQ
jgi:phage regulator Rha-like protein